MRPVLLVCTIVISLVAGAELAVSAWEMHTTSAVIERTSFFSEIVDRTIAYPIVITPTRTPPTPTPTPAATGTPVPTPTPEVGTQARPRIGNGWRRGIGG